MARRTKVLLTCLVLLALVVGGGATWYYWLLRSTTNPLHLSVVKVEEERGGWKVVHLEVANASRFDVTFQGEVAASQQPLDGPCFYSLVDQIFPNPGGGSCQLSAGETVTGTIRMGNPVSCSYHYQWEPQFKLVNRIRGAGRSLDGKAPDWLVRFLLTFMIDERYGDTEEVLIPEGTAVPITNTAKPEPQAR